MPALSRAKLRAQAINCVSNLKQLGLAHAMYVSDCGKSFPYDPNALWMATLIGNNAKVDAVRVCPSARTVTTRKGTPGDGLRVRRL